MVALVPEVVPLLCQALMSGIAGTYVASLPRKTRAARWLVVLFAGNTGFAVSYMLTMVEGPTEAWAVRFNLGLYVGVAVAAFAAVRVSYTFLARPFRREERGVTAALASALAVLVAVTLYAAAAVDVRLFRPLLYGYGVFLVAAALWALAVHLRQARRYRRLAAADATRRVDRAGAAEGHVAVAGLAGLTLLLSVLNALATFGVLPLFVIQFGSLLIELVIAVGFVVVFINHAPEPTTVQAKLVGVALGAVLALLGLASLLLLQPAELAAAAGNTIPAAAAVRFTPDGTGGYRVARVAAGAPAAGGRRAEATPGEGAGSWERSVVALPFAFPLGGEVYREVALSRIPYLAFGAEGPCLEGCLGVSAPPEPDHPIALAYVVSADFDASGWPVVTAAPDRLDVVWTLTGFAGRHSEHRASLFPDGTVEIAYRGPEHHPRAGAAGLHLGGPDRVEASFAGALPTAVAPGVALVDPYGARYAALAHARTARMVPLVLAATAFVLVLVPLFLRRGVLGPLAALLAGVERVDRGERDVRLEAGANDEFGTLVRRFNGMAASLGAAEARLRQYAGRLEERVAERTRALRAANADLAHKRDALEASLAELRAAQDRLVQAEKLASLGRLTAGIAHEIKNPLNFVNNFAGLSREAVDDLGAALHDGDPEAVEAILEDLRLNTERIEAHGLRADRIVQGMLLHARGATGERAPADLNGLLRLAAEGVARAYADRTGGDGAVPIELDLSPDVGEVAVVPEGVLQVAASLLDNALYAAAHAEAPRPVRLSSTRHGGAVEVRVVDEGAGMDAETAGRVFEPFFTTKPPGEGTGLGLSLAYDIVTAGHGGRIEVESRPGEGTTFTVRLPTEPLDRLGDAPALRCEGAPRGGAG